MQRWGGGVRGARGVRVRGLWYGGQSRGTARRGLGAGGGGADVPGARAAHGDADAVGRAGRDAAWGCLRAICGGVSRRADGTADGGGGLTETDGETDEHRARGWIRDDGDGMVVGAGRTVVSTATRSSGGGSGDEEDDVLRRFALGDDAYLLLSFSSSSYFLYPPCICLPPNRLLRPPLLPPRQLPVLLGPLVALCTRLVAHSNASGHTPPSLVAVLSPLLFGLSSPSSGFPAPPPMPSGSNKDKERAAAAEVLYPTIGDSAVLGRVWGVCEGGKGRGGDGGWGRW
ncbi:hypothetical protein DFH09DRAFT_1441733 [Mycena vulgaris]|nr:hypothetical protein DFH09DRAFT_1441733 [Mycena vulgaris]